MYIANVLTFDLYSTKYAYLQKLDTRGMQTLQVKFTTRLGHHHIGFTSLIFIIF